MGAGAVVATGKVLLHVDSSQVGPGMQAAAHEVEQGGQKTVRALSATEIQASKTKLAQESYTRAVARYGEISPQARAALNRYSEAELQAGAAARTAAVETHAATQKTGLFSRSMKTAEGDTNRFGRGLLSGSGLATAFGRSMAFASTTFLGAAGFTLVVRSAVGEVADLQHQLERSDALFGSSAKAIAEWSKTTAFSLGLSRVEALKLTNNFGQMLVGFGVAPAKAAATSKSLTKLAVDMAAFKGVPVEEAMAAIQRGLAGQGKGLKTYGIAIDTVRLKAEALRMGLLKGNVDMVKVGEAQQKVALATARLAGAKQKSGGENTVGVASAELALQHAHDALAKSISGTSGTLNAEQKALAATSILVHDSSVQHDFFAKHQNSVAVMTKKVHAELGNLKLLIGTALLPTVTHLLSHFVHWIEHLRKTGELHKDVNSIVHTGVGIVKGFADVVAFLWPLLKTATHWAGGLKDMIGLLMLAFAVNKVREWGTAMVGGFVKSGKAAIGAAAVITGASEEEAAAQSAAAVASATAWEVSMAAAKAAVRSFLVSTVIGILVVGVAIAIEQIIIHFDTIKRWFGDFFGWLKSHIAIVAIFAPWLAVTLEIIKHWGDVKDVVAGVGKFFATVFVHPIRAIEDLFSLLWQKMEKLAYEAVLAIIEPFSHLPFGMGKWAQDMKNVLHAKLAAMQTDAENAGTAIGTGIGSHMVAAFGPYGTQIQGQIAGLTGTAGQIGMTDPGGKFKVPAGAGLISPVPKGATQAIIGTPYAKGTTHDQKDWQSGNAIDIQVAPHTPVLAVEDGTIIKVTIGPPGVVSVGTKKIAGSSVTLQGGFNTYFYTHLESVAVAEGDPVKRGDLLGHTGVLNHLHFATMHGDPQGFESLPGATATSKGSKSAATTTTTTTTTPVPTPIVVPVKTTKPKGLTQQALTTMVGGITAFLTAAKTAAGPAGFDPLERDIVKHIRQIEDSLSIHMSPTALATAKVELNKWKVKLRAEIKKVAADVKADAAEAAKAFATGFSVDTRLIDRNMADAWAIQVRDFGRETARHLKAMQDVVTDQIKAARSAFNVEMKAFDEDTAAGIAGLASPLQTPEEKALADFLAARQKTADELARVQREKDLHDAILGANPLAIAAAQDAIDQAALDVTEKGLTATAALSRTAADAAAKTAQDKYQDERDALKVHLTDLQDLAEQHIQDLADAAAQAYQDTRDAASIAAQNLHDDNQIRFDADLAQWGIWLGKKQAKWSDFLTWLSQNGVDTAGITPPSFTPPAAPAGPPLATGTGQPYTPGSLGAQGYFLLNQPATGTGGGKVQYLAEGGIVPGEFTGALDTQRAMLTPGEGVLTRSDMHSLLARAMSPVPRSLEPAAGADNSRSITVNAVFPHATVREAHLFSKSLEFELRAL